MLRDRIVAALDTALPALPSPAAPDYALPLLLSYAVSEPERVDPRLLAVVHVLRESPELAVFDGYMEVVDTSARRVEIHELAGWLLRRAREVGSQQAVTDLERYMAASDLPFQFTVALAGLNLTETCELTPDWRLLPWDAVEPSFHKQHTDQRLVETFHWPTGALVHELWMPKLHVKQEDLEWLRAGTVIPHEAVQDTLFCIGLTGPTAPYVLASWIAPPNWAPVFSGGGGQPHLEGVPRRRDWPRGACEKTRQLVSAFMGLKEKAKRRLRVPMQRLNTAMRRGSSVDAAIDLGIALESLFLGDMPADRGELTFRLRVRAARYTQTEPEARQCVYELAGTLYKLRSTAVHRGQLPKGLSGEILQQLLEAGYALTASTITRFIVEGEPDWRRIELS